MLFLQTGIGIVISLLITPFLILSLGTSDYGLWILILSVVGWFNVLDLGLPAAVQRYITIALEAGDNIKVNSVFSTSLALFGGVGLVAVLGLFVLASNPSILGAPSIDQSTISYALTILSMKVLWDFAMNAFHGFFAGMLRFDIDANITSLNSVVKAIIVLALVPTFQIDGLIYATLLADLLSNSLKLFYCKRLFPALSFRMKWVRRAEAATLLNFSKHVIAIGFATTLNSKSAPLIINQLLDQARSQFFQLQTALRSIAMDWLPPLQEFSGPCSPRKLSRRKHGAAFS